MLLSTTTRTTTGQYEIPRANLSCSKPELIYLFLRLATRLGLGGTLNAKTCQTTLQLPKASLLATCTWKE